jgi:hypothetical protein
MPKTRAPRKPKEIAYRTYPMMIPEKDDAVHNRARRQARGTVVRYVTGHNLDSGVMDELLAMLDLQSA